MKAALFLLGFCFAVSLNAGEVDFSNTSTSLLKTNNCSGGADGVTTGAGHYTVGLYAAPFGTTDPNGFSLIATTPSQSAPFGNGRFNGGFISPPGLVAGVPVSIQIRVWSTFAGSTYEQAISYAGGQTRYIGVSAIGFVIPTTGTGLPPRVMGNDYGQIPGFTFYACITPPNPALPLTNVMLHIIRSNNTAHVVSWINAASTHLLESTPTVPGSNQWTAILTNVGNANGRLSYSSTNSSARFYRLRRW